VTPMEKLKIVKLPKLKVIRLKGASIKLCKVAKSYRRLYVGGGGVRVRVRGGKVVPSAFPTSVKFCEDVAPTLTCYVF